MITDQHIYLGPRLHAFGVGYGTVFHNGLHPRLKEIIAQCPAVGSLVVPVKEAGAVRRELDFDYAHNMRGTRGKYVTFYREVQNWLKGRKQTNAQQQVR